MAQEVVEISIYIHRWVLQICALTLGCFYDGSRMKVIEVIRKLVGMLRFDSKRLKNAGQSESNQEVA